MSEEKPGKPGFVGELRAAGRDMGLAGMQEGGVPAGRVRREWAEQGG